MFLQNLEGTAYCFLIFQYCCSEIRCHSDFWAFLCELLFPSENLTSHLYSTYCEILQWCASGNFFFFCLMLGTWWAFSIENSYPFSLVLLFKNNFLSFVLCSVFVKLLVVGCWCPGLTRKHFLKTFVFPVFHCLVSFCSTSWTVLSNSVSSKNFYLPVVFLKVVFCSDH